MRQEMMSQWTNGRLSGFSKGTVLPAKKRSKGERRGTIFCLVFSLAFFAGCPDEGEAVVVPSAQRKSDEDDAAKKAADAADEASIGYVYNAVNKRDPFKTYFDELVVEEQEARNLTELQRFELDNLKLMGVVVGTATPMALLEDPTGKGHTVKIGSLVGKNFGQVKQIRRGEIIIQEEFRDFTGRRIRTTKSLKLRPDKDKEQSGL